MRNRRRCWIFCLLLLIVIRSDYEAETATANTTLNMLPSVERNLEPINGTANYRIYDLKKGKEDKHWFDGRGLGLQHMKCVRKGNCEKLNYSTCLGAKLLYKYTSLDLTISRDQYDVRERLSKYEVLRHIPKCWAVIQPFLCAIFTPKCEVINGEDMVYLPSLEMCRITLEPCSILHNSSYFPEFLQCNGTHFPSKCNNDVREIKFNLTGRCMEPLVPADTSISYHPIIEGCDLQCKDPLYTDDEHRQIHKLVAWGSSLCLLANVFVVATFLIDWSNASKYPALIVFYINLCFLIACLGWLAQFTPGSREDIVCRKDGTLRHSEPTAGQNLSCVVIFVIVYYFLVAAMVWFVFLTYAWHMRAVGNFQDRIDKKGSYFHLVAWSLPLVLTITTLALSEVDGNSTTGICFVGYLNHSIRAGLLLGPLLGVILIGGYFILRGMIILYGLKRFANGIKSTLASSKIHVIIVRMGLCALFTLLFILVAITCHIYEFRHSNEWLDSLKQYIICRIFSPFNEHIKCKIENRPSVSILQLHLLCLFGAGIAMSSWCWTPSSMETWRRFVRKCFGQEVQEDIKMPKHKVIAQTWAKRKEFEDKGRLSITLCNTHTDPVGLNFDMYDINSSETVEISSTWANYLPKFVKRRMALTTIMTNSSSQGRRKSSIDSEISFSVCRVSVESRRNSLDSQVSVKIAGMKTKVASRSRSNAHHHHHHHHHHHANKRAATAASAKRHYRRKYNGRKESSTSVESQMIALRKTMQSSDSYSHKLDLFTHKGTSKKYNSGKRRSGLDAADIAEFLSKNSELILPFIQNQCMSSSSTHTDLMTKQNTEHDGVEIEEIVENEFNNKTRRKKISPQKDDIKPNPQNSSYDSSNHRISRGSTRSKQSKKSQSITLNNKTIIGSFNKRHANKKQRNSNSCSSKHKSSNNASENKDSLNINVKGLNLNLQSSSNYDHKARDYLNLRDSYSEMDIPLDVMLNTSFSEITPKHMQSSHGKSSCDIGIQTNAFEMDGLAKDNNNTNSNQDEGEANAETDHKLRTSPNLENHSPKKQYETNETNNISEMHSLLPNKYKENKAVLSESEKLKMLLLP